MSHDPTPSATEGALRARLEAPDCADGARDVETPERATGGRTAPPALFRTYEEFLAATPLPEIRSWCSRKAARANRTRLLSGRPAEKITTDDVVAVLTNARGRCTHCGSLAVERAPQHPDTRKPLPWAHIGRRIGSLDHVMPRIDGGTNTRANLAWSCHWCNTWPSERTPGAADHGAIQPPTTGAGEAGHA